MTGGTRLRIGSRGSALALWQARHVAAALEGAASGLRVEIVEIATAGDLDRTSPLSAMGGKGVFVRALERALLAGEVDLAVHSLKDLPARLPEGLLLLPTVARAPVEDVLVLRDDLAGTPLAQLPPGLRVGTGSLRRAALLRRHVPGAEPVPIRGNVPTRLSRVGRDVDAVVLARAGIERLGLAPAGAVVLPVDPFLPAPCQGLLGLEARADDRRVADLVARVADPEATACMGLERAFLERLGADCTVPLSALAVCDGPDLSARALVLSPGGERVARAAWHGPVARAEVGGRTLAERLLAAGGEAILAEIGR